MGSQYLPGVKIDCSYSYHIPGLLALACNRCTKTAHFVYSNPWSALDSKGYTEFAGYPRPITKPDTRIFTTMMNFVETIKDERRRINEAHIKLSFHMDTPETWTRASRYSVFSST